MRKFAALVIAVLAGLAGIWVMRVSAQVPPPMGPPVGAVVGFALKADDAAKLAPQWLPADGRTVNDQRSPLHGKTLPDLRGRVLLGVEANADASDNAKMNGGSTSATIQLRGKTGTLRRTECTHFEHEARNNFPDQQAAVWDVLEAKEAACQHEHAIQGGYEASALPLPPHRGVVFLVRVR